MSSTTPTPTAAACLSCQTLGGAIRAGYHRPIRTRGLCVRCYNAQEYRRRNGLTETRQYTRRRNYPACLSCGVPETILRGLCGACYQRASLNGSATQYPACGAVPVPYQPTWETFEGFPEGHAPIFRDYPGQPALVAPLHPPLPAPDRWGHVVWFSRPRHDPIGQALFDRETRYVETRAA